MTIRKKEQYIIRTDQDNSLYYQDEIGKQDNMQDNSSMTTLNHPLEGIKEQDTLNIFAKYFQNTEERHKRVTMMRNMLIERGKIWCIRYY